MTRDPRLSLNDYSVIKYHKDEKLELENFMGQYGEGIWRPMIEKSADRVLKSIVKGVNEPFQSDPLLTKELNQAIEIIEDNLKGNSRVNFQWGIETSTAIEWLGKVLAELCESDYNTWKKVHKVIQDYQDLYRVWVNSLPIEGIKRNINRIKEMPFYQHPLELVYTWGYYQEKQYWDGFSDFIKVEEDQANDTWELIKSIMPFDNEFRLKPVVQFKTDLLYRYDKKVWVDWIHTLPFLHMKDAALGRIGNLDELMELLRYSVQQNNEEITALLIRKYLELVKRITVNLEQYSAGVKNQLDGWTKEELPMYMNDITKILMGENQPLGIRLTLSIIRQIKVRDYQKDRVEDELRKAFIAGLAEQGEVEIQSFLNEPISQGLLIGALLFYYKRDQGVSEDSINLLWEAYLSLLKQERFYWDIGLSEQEDDFHLLWMLGGVLAEFEDGVFILNTAQDSLNARTEGWQFDRESFFRLNRKVVHLLIIGAMASDWLSQQDKQDKSQTLYDFVFAETNTRIRQLPDHEFNEFDPLIRQVWSRLIMIYPNSFTQKAYDAAKDFDHLNHILLALTILLKNIQRKGADKTLEPELVELMKTSYDTMLPLVRMKYGRFPERIKWYESFDWWEG